MPILRIQPGKTNLVVCFIGLLLLVTPLISATANNQLPALGDSSSSMSVKQEQRLGEAWLRLYRRQVPVNSDPLLSEYTEKLLQKIARHNPDVGDTFSLVIVNNPLLNAFAVPGGVIGINTGLFQYAQTEGQFASVLAHELAHLGQRHYARGVEKQKGQQIIGMAALLASLVIATTSGGDAGIAAMQAARAGIIDSQLRFSRAFEQEADHVGMATLAAAGFDPLAMAKMFEQMQRATRFATEPPEFLLTHPITASRIADAKNRARDYPGQESPGASSVAYDLMRSRVLFFQEETPREAIHRFENELRGVSPSESGSRYGLVLALTAAKQYERAQKVLQPLLDLHPDSPAIIIARADIEFGQNKTEQGLARIKNAVDNYPESYALNMHYSRLLMANTDYRAATDVLRTIRKQRPKDPAVWYQLAEVAGLSGDILTLHQARAEYFILYGDFDRAGDQLDNLLKKFADNKEATTNAAQRKEDIERLRKESRL